MQTAEFGAKTYYLQRLLLKTAWRWKKLDREGAHIPGAPSLNPLINWRPPKRLQISERRDLPFHGARICAPAVNKRNKPNWYTTMATTLFCPSPTNEATIFYVTISHAKGKATCSHNLWQTFTQFVFPDARERFQDRRKCPLWSSVWD